MSLNRRNQLCNFVSVGAVSLAELRVAVVALGSMLPLLDGPLYAIVQQGSSVERTLKANGFNPLPNKIWFANIVLRILKVRRPLRALYRSMA